MSSDLNQPLQIGQILTPRNAGKWPNCKLIRWAHNSDEMIWTLESAEDGEQFQMTLSQIYARFKFAN